MWVLNLVRQKLFLLFLFLIFTGLLDNIRIDIFKLYIENLNILKIIVFTVDFIIHHSSGLLTQLRQE